MSLHQSQKSEQSHQTYLNYQNPTLEKILPLLTKVKIFSVLDAKYGFHQVKLDETSLQLTTFWLPFGWYYYTRMSFGIS